MKVGDRVIVVESNYGASELQRGQTGVLVEDHGHYLGVIMDNKHPHLFEPENLVWNFRVGEVEEAQ